MFKILIALSVVIAIVRGGYLGAPLAYHAPVAVPVATSYQNTFKISAAPVPVVIKSAPLFAAPAVHYAPAPAVHYAPAPAVHYAPAPIIKSPLLAAPLHYSYH